MAARWDEVQRIRAFLEDAEKRAKAMQGEGYDQSEMKEYIAWARGIAESLDPLKEEAKKEPPGEDGEFPET